MQERVKSTTWLGELWPGNDVEALRSRFAKMSGLGALGLFILKHGCRGAVAGVLGAEILGFDSVKTIQAAILGSVIDLCQASYRFGVKK